VPESCLTTGSCKTPKPTAINGITHVHAYYAMGDCQMAAHNTGNITDWVGLHSSLMTNTAVCSMIIPSAAGGLGMTGMAVKPKNGNLPDPTGADFECSNSSWP